MAQKRTQAPVPTPVTPGAVSTCFELRFDDTQLKDDILRHLHCSLARDAGTALPQDWWLSTCLAVRDHVLERYMHTQGTHAKNNARRMYYLSLEYLMGRLLHNNLVNTGLLGAARKALKDLGQDPDTILEEFVDMGLGNGGLGRLAACFLDSLATLEYPAIGYGIHYEFGLFRQSFVNGRQVESADDWLQHGTPWQICRPENRLTVPLYGHVEMTYDDCGVFRPTWKPANSLVGIPWDIPIVGYGAGAVNFLRLWESRASQEFDFKIFNEGGYIDAVREKAVGETISKVLYPNDKTAYGKELRLVQQIFFVSCSIQDIIRRYKRSNEGWDAFPDKVAMQLNDTHPAIAVAELMRLLVDTEHMSWEKAWAIVVKVFGYTNHTLLAEALEKWSVPLFEKVLPRHLQIIYEINRRHLENVAAHFPGDSAKLESLSLIEEGPVKHVRMAHLAVVGSHSVNGVAALHTRLLKEHLLRDFNAMWPEKFNNKTNGITPRRWLRLCNPGLSALIDSKIGDCWTKNLDQLRHLEPLADDAKFRSDFMGVKRANKVRLASVIKDLCKIDVSPDALFDVQIKRLHEYKRQHLNLLHIVTLYRRLLNNPDLDVVPRVFIFGAKAAPGYDLAKEIIHAINAVGARINADTRIKGKLKVAFLPDYRVSLAEKIIPAADLSEQISTAGKEASGTGNMKLALNGSLTIGTLDGANVEIQEEVGDENIFIFGLTVEQVHELQSRGYNPWNYYENDEELRAVLDWLRTDYFTPDQPGSLSPIVTSLLDHGDPYLVLADYRAYCETQARVSEAFLDKTRWAKMAILNTARMGKFSSDRTIHEYAREIWNLRSIPVPHEGEF